MHKTKDNKKLLHML